MGIVASLDKVLFCNTTTKYSVLRMKTDDTSIPEAARSPYRYPDPLIRFTAVGYEIPQTETVKLELIGEWKTENTVFSSKWSDGMRSFLPLLPGYGIILPPDF